MKEKLRGFKIGRVAVLAMVMLILTGVLVYRLFYLQIVRGEEYADGFELQIQKSRILKSTRGNIYDRNGKLLAYNELIYSVTLEDNQEYETTRERQMTLNGIAYRLTEIIKANGDSLEEELHITLNEQEQYEFTVEGIALDRFRADIFGHLTIDKLKAEEKETTAQEIIDFLCGDTRFFLFEEDGKAYTAAEREQYGLPQEWSREKILEVLNIRYALSLNSYQRYLSVPVATDISPETIASVSENRDILSGVEVVEDSKRVYDDAVYFSHILGYTGKISVEELEQLQEVSSKYDTTSVVGKAGIEQYMDLDLQGTNGVEEVYINNVGKVIGMTDRYLEPMAGSDIFLTIDSELQQAVYKILEQQIAGVLLRNISSSPEFDNANRSSSESVVIPINDVYYALLDNQIVDLAGLEKAEAGSIGAQVYTKHQQRISTVTEQLRQELAGGGSAYKDLSKELQGIQSYLVNTVLSQKMGLLDRYAVDVEDEIYQDWTVNEVISMREYLKYAINKEWIDITQIESDERYMDEEEMYRAVVEALFAYLQEDRGYQKLLCRYMLMDNTLSGQELCLLLYEQGVLDEDDDYRRLLSGEWNSYTFITEKIRSLELTPAQLALDPCSGSAVITDPSNGEVLACVTYPGYDLNRLANQVDSAYYARLIEDQSLPLYNRATQQLTAPGSTFKPVTAVAGLQEGVIDVDTAITCNGIFERVETPLRCWNLGGHGTITSVSSALRHSCNVYFTEISYRMGQADGSFTDEASLAKIQEYAALFDLDKPSGVQLSESEPQVTDRYGIPSAIGQGTHNYATVQVGRYATTLANQGNSYQLNLIRETKDSAGNTLVQYEAEAESYVDLPDYVWSAVADGMESMAASNAVLNKVDVSVAGKTGTAEESKVRPDHGLFIGYAPAGNPEIAMAVRIEYGYGSGNAVLASGDILKYYFELEDEDQIITGQASEASDNTHAD